MSKPVSLTLEQVSHAVQGYCPWCSRYIKGWVDRYSIVSDKRLEARGIDPATGHLMLCPQLEFYLD